MSDKARHEERVRQKVREQEADELYLREAIRKVVLKFLLEDRGYLPEEVETDRAFEVSVDGRVELASTDYVINLGGRRLMAVKCTVTPDSSERHIVAFCRVADRCLIPFSAVTDGMAARVLDTRTGKAVSEGLDSIPRREEAVRMAEGLEPAVCPADRMEKEKRILLAFESLCCPIDRS
ncbi:MAG: type I restriction enzyme HsdR N-terminal domain-containing protein [Thermodesulfovibrionales bacterium]